ncbi:MAG: hypothetical protein ISR43_04930, partial [Acidimicrobiia bacterium]|nr:hypothetical protein [Acidimicrobiia bacterium]
PLSERLLNKEFTAGQIIIVDVATEEELAEAGDDASKLVFRSIEGFEPPTVEMAVEGAE